MVLYYFCKDNTVPSKVLDSQQAIIVVANKEVALITSCNFKSGKYVLLHVDICPAHPISARQWLSTQYNWAKGVIQSLKSWYRKLLLVACMESSTDFKYWCPTGHAICLESCLPKLCGHATTLDMQAGKEYSIAMNLKHLYTQKNCLGKKRLYKPLKTVQIKA